VIESVTVNPYQSPTTPPEPNLGRKKFVLGILALFAIPAAGIAGGASCTGVAPLMPQFWLVAIAVGFIPMVAILSGARYALGRSWKAGHVAALLGLLLATPVALTIAGFIMVQTILPARPDPALPEAWSVLIAGCAAFTMWSVGYWLGLSGMLTKFWSWLKK